MSSGPRSVADIMRDLSHTIALEIEKGRSDIEGLRQDVSSDKLDEHGSVSALDEDEVDAFYGVEDELPW